jgi:hypothetical protein
VRFRLVGDRGPVGFKADDAMAKSLPHDFRGHGLSGGELIEIDPDARVGVYEYVRIKEYIVNLFEGRVNVVDREGLKPYVRPTATADAIYAL